MNLNETKIERLIIHEHTSRECIENVLINVSKKKYLLGLGSLWWIINLLIFRKNYFICIEMLIMVTVVCIYNHKIISQTCFIMILAKYLQILWVCRMVSSCAVSWLLWSWCWCDDRVGDDNWDLQRMMKQRVWVMVI